MDYSFQFTVKSDYATTANSIRNAIAKLGHKSKERIGGEFVFPVETCKFFLYLSESNGISTLRILLKNIGSSETYILQTYDRFLVALEKSGLDIPVVPGKPYIVKTVAIGGGVDQEFVGKQSLSIGGATLGGLMFGDLGAIIGSFRGPIKGKTKSRLSNSSFFLICYSNGMVEEKEVRKNTKLYAEVMAKLNAAPVISKDELTLAYEEQVSKKKSLYDTPLALRLILAFLVIACFIWFLWKIGYFQLVFPVS